MTWASVDPLTEAERSALEGDLRRASTRCEKAENALRDAERGRDKTIRQASRRGMSTRQIAPHVSLTAQRVQQIAAKH